MCNGLTPSIHTQACSSKACLEVMGRAEKGLLQALSQALSQAMQMLLDWSQAMVLLKEKQEVELLDLELELAPAFR